MALKLENHETLYGVKAEHWVVQSININEKHGYADITLQGYYDEQAYLDGKAPLETKKTKAYERNNFASYFSKKAKNANEENKNIYSLAYEFVKHNDPFFKDSKDC